MSKAFVICPACKTKTRAGHTECPRCEVTLPKAPASREVKSWAVIGSQLRPMDLGLALSGIVFLFVIARSAFAPAPPPPKPLPEYSSLSEMARLEATGPVPERAAGVSAGTVDTVSPEPTTAGRQWMRAGAFAEAVEHFERAVADRPEDPRTRHELAMVLVELERPRDALRHLEAAVRLDGTDWGYLTDFANVLADLGLWDRAVGEYRDAARIQPEDPGSLARLGRALSESGDPLSAVEVLIRATKMGPEDPDLFLTLGRSYDALGRQADAAAAYRRYIALAPGGSSADKARTRIAGAQGTPKAPVEASRQGQVVGPYTRAAEVN